MKCSKCHENLPKDCFRKNSKDKCVWCEWESPEKRAKARYHDKLKFAKHEVKITLTKFVDWYLNEPDRCKYCGLTFEELKKLKIKRGIGWGGYCVAWDIDRKDSLGHYEKGNLVLSCFVCNFAKGRTLEFDEAKVIGSAVRKVWDKRLALLEKKKEKV